MSSMAAAPVRPQAESLLVVALTVQDRCDRCGAQAYIRTQLESGRELLWCAHHFRLNADALGGQTVVLQDETYKLNER